MWLEIAVIAAIVVTLSFLYVEALGNGTHNKTTGEDFSATAHAYVLEAGQELDPSSTPPILALSISDKDTATVSYRGQEGKAKLIRSFSKGSAIYYRARCKADKAGVARTFVIARPRAVKSDSVVGTWGISVNAEGMEPQADWLTLSEGGTGTYGTGAFDLSEAETQPLDLHGAERPITWQSERPAGGALRIVATTDEGKQIVLVAE